jgi:hypothetical protein
MTGVLTKTKRAVGAEEHMLWCNVFSVNVSLHNYI